MKPLSIDPEASQSEDAAAHARAPSRLLDGSGTPFERFLVASSRAECMPQASLERLALSLRVAGNALPQRAEAPPAMSVSRVARVGSIAGLGAVGLIAALGTLRSSAPEPREPALAPVITAPARAARAPSAPEAITPAASVAPAPEAPAVARARPVIAPRPRAHALPPAPKPLGLRDELRALESVQMALRSGHSSQAARGLAEYTAKFPRGELALEAQLLGVELAVVRGEGERARTLARELLARPGAARYRDRLEALVPASDATAARAGVNVPDLHINGTEVNR